MSALLEVHDLKKHFPIQKGVLARVTGHVRAVDGVSFYIAGGETLGLVGESGCGKSTVGRTLLKLIEPSSGRILVDGTDITALDQRQMFPYRRKMQMIYPGPLCVAQSADDRRRYRWRAADHPRHRGSAGASGARRRAVRARGTAPGADELTIRTSSPAGSASASGLRARSALEPDLIIGDEPVSALDVSIQAQIINLLMDLQDEYGLSYLFVAHDLAVVEHISHRVAVMYLGRIVEIADKTSLFEMPLHPYTEALLSAVPVPKARAKGRKRMILTGDVPSPINPPSGCHFHTRCPYAMTRCRHEAPALREVQPGHWASCHLHDGGLKVPLGA